MGNNWSKRNFLRNRVKFLLFSIIRMWWNGYRQIRRFGKSRSRVIDFASYMKLVDLNRSARYRYIIFEHKYFCSDLKNNFPIHNNINLETFSLFCCLITKLKSLSPTLFFPNSNKISQQKTVKFNVNFQNTLNNMLTLRNKNEKYYTCSSTN